MARFRVHGLPVPDPRFLGGTIDLAALENGGGLVSCSDAFYGSAARLILPGRARSMGEGWENARRRDDGHDWALFRLAGAGTVRHVELDTSYFLGNAPGWVRLAGCRVASDDDLASAEWFDLLPRERSQPDTRQRFARRGGPAGHPRAARRLPGRRDGAAAGVGRARRPPGDDIGGRRQRKADCPVSAWPMTSWCTSEVPS